jgi:hypothetical protein
MPEGLRKYMEVELFLEFSFQLGRASRSAWHVVGFTGEGFQYMQHKKALYFDGHDCPDVVDYRQNCCSCHYDTYSLQTKLFQLLGKVHGPGYQALIMVDHSPKACSLSMLDFNTY